VGLARELWGTAPPVVLVSIGPASLEVGEGLSETVAPAVTRAADLVATVVEAHRRA
jgi:Ni,Fe-hydrogenase maturation factor